jgi:hypothetical protein
MLHATATITNLPGHHLQQALNLASDAAPNLYLVTHWQATACGTYHLHATVSAGSCPKHALGVAKRIAAAWEGANLCSSGRSLTHTTLVQGA